MPKKDEKPDVEKNQQLVESTEETASEETGDVEPKESIWNKVTDFAQKGLDTIKTGATKVSQMADDATKMGKIKYEVYSLKNERQTLLQQTGEKIWALHKKKQLKQADKQLAEGFNQYTELSEKIENLEQEGEGIHLTE